VQFYTITLRNTAPPQGNRTNRFFPSPFGRGVGGEALTRYLRSPWTDCEKSEFPEICKSPAGYVRFDRQAPTVAIWRQKNYNNIINFAAG